MPEDQTTSGQAPDAPQSGQADRTSERRQPGRDQQQQEGQAPQQKSADKPGKPAKVNWQDDPEFRKMQAGWQNTLQQERAQKAELEKKLRAVEEAGLSDYEKAQKEAERAREELEQIKQERAQEQEMMRLQQQILQDKQRLNRRFGIPLEELDDVESYDEAEEKAIEYFKANATGQAQQTQQESKEQERRAANRPNLGTGNREVAAVAEKARQAWEGANPQEYIRAVQEGKRENVW